MESWQPQAGLGQGERIEHQSEGSSLYKIDSADETGAEQPGQGCYQVPRTTPCRGRYPSRERRVPALPVPGSVIRGLPESFLRIELIIELITRVTESGLSFAGIVNEAARVGI